jgi:hypothetical protein
MQPILVGPGQAEARRDSLGGMVFIFAANPRGTATLGTVQCIVDAPPTAAFRFRWLIDEAPARSFLTFLVEEHVGPFASAARGTDGCFPPAQPRLRLAPGHQ